MVNSVLHADLSIEISKRRHQDSNAIILSHATRRGLRCLHIVLLFLKKGVRGERSKRHDPTHPNAEECVTL